MTLRRPAVLALVPMLLAGAAVAGLSSPAAAGDPLTDVKINEVESNGGTPGDWVEIRNTSASSTDVSGLRFKDNDDTRTFAIAAGTTIPAGGFLVLDEATFGFGLGAADSARLFMPDGTTPVDAYTWTTHAAVTYGRCPDGTGAFGARPTATKGTANDCPPTGYNALRVNEVESNGDPVGDWAEVVNIGTDPVDISGLRFKDSDDTRTFAVAAGTTIPGGGFYALNEAEFGFGLGAADSARLFQPDGTTLIDSHTWTEHAVTSYGRCPDGTGAWATTGSSTKAAPNNCAPLVRINEIEADGGSPADWVELYNYGAAGADVSGLVVKDSQDANSYAVPAGTTIPGGGYLVLEQGALGYDLDAADALRLFAGNGTTLYDSYTWASHAATSYGRCPNGSGAFAQTQVVTKGAVNNCPGDLVTEPWPGGATVAIADTTGSLGGDVSGLAYDGSGSAAPGVLWAVDNGAGALLRLLWNGTGWVSDATNGWSNAGKSLKYADGTGTPDTEGVALGGPSSAAGIYTATERNNQANGVSRIAVLRYDAGGAATTLTATHEWVLTPDLPAVSPNLGIEDVVWVPDTYLVGAGFKDETTGAAYAPASYPNHGNGLFLVALEANGRIYAYALNHATNAFTRVASFGSGLPGAMALNWEEEKDQLWVVCDDTCSGRSGVFTVDTSVGATQGTFVARHYYERPTGMPNLNNEGFTTTPRSECVSGVKPVFWSDDTNTGGNALRAGTLTCTPRVAQSVAITSTRPNPAVVGQTYAVTTTGGASGSSVALSVSPASATVCSLTGATVTFADPGTCVVQADQAGNDDFAPGTASQTVTVIKASTETQVAVRPTRIVAVMSVRSPGAAALTGSVDFLVDGTVVGSAPVAAGIATFDHVVPSGATREVTAVYQGNGDLTGSSGTTFRRDPTITATVQPSGPLSASGWYAGAVSIVFTCEQRGAIIVGGCPQTVVLGASGANQSVTRSITAEDGGSASVTVDGLDLDLQAPQVSVVGVKDGKTYSSRPNPRCQGSDGLSGLADCTVRVTRTGRRSFTVVATATDLAGNVSTATKRYTLKK